MDWYKLGVSAVIFLCGLLNVPGAAIGIIPEVNAWVVGVTCGLLVAMLTVD
jgi:hypothetical protein